MNPEFSELALWAYVVMLSILVGGSLFEFRVLVYVWSSSPPDSVRAWNANPEYALKPPQRFFAFITIPLMLLSPLNAYLAWKSTSPAHEWLLGSALLVIAVIIVTVTYFAPVMISLTERRGAGMESDTIIRKVRMWVGLQYVRIALVIIAWIAALYAFRWRG